jgi:poly(3-hydroxybutyrate) depolymerase
MSAPPERGRAAAGAQPRTLETATHGRYLVRPPGGTPSGVLYGFHGYAENAETHLRALDAIPGLDDWLVVAVQALHPFHTRDQRVVANWMTSQDRELAIADNIAYVRRVVAAVEDEQAVRTPRVFAGFSQGGAMAYRAAAHLGAAGLIILAADVAPDVASIPGVRLPAVLLGRGTRDPWYTVEKCEADLRTLARIGVPVEQCVFDGVHEWSAPFREAAGDYLKRLALPAGASETLPLR